MHLLRREMQFMDTRFTPQRKYFFLSHFSTSRLIPHVDSIANAIRSFVTADPKKMYTAQQFESNIISTITAADFYSEHLGGIQWLSNGNTLTVESSTGFLREVDSTGKNVWTYNRGGEIVRALRFAPEFPGLKYLTTTVIDQPISPADFVLAQNYPDPFNPSTTIEYQLPNKEHATLKVFDMLGGVVVALMDEEQSSGDHSIQFNGSSSSSGIYFYRLISGMFVETKRMVLLK